VRALVVPVADHQVPAIFAALGGEPGDVGIHLGLQRLGQHPPRSLPDDLIDQRRTAILPALVARAAISDYGEHRVVPSRPAFQRRSCLRTSTRSPGRYTPPRPIHRFQALLAVASAATVSSAMILADRARSLVHWSDGGAEQDQDAGTEGQDQR